MNTDIIQSICMLPSWINKLLFLFNLEYKWLDVMTMLFVTSQGLFYALVYGCNTKTKKALRETIRKGFCCRDTKRETFSDVDSVHSEKSNRMIDSRDFETYDNK